MRTAWYAIAALALVLCGQTARAEMIAPAQAMSYNPESLPIEACEAKRAYVLAWVEENLPHQCDTVDDCATYFYDIDSCAAPLVLRKHELAGKKKQQLLKLQDKARKTCAPQYDRKPPCDPMPVTPQCLSGKCVAAP